MSCQEATTAMIEVILGIQGQKFKGLAYIASFMEREISEKRSITKAFIESQFVYCPLICIFHGRRFKNKMNHIHKRTLSITYNYKPSSFGELLNKNNFVTIHHRKLRALAKEIYKVIHKIFPSLLNKLFMSRQCSHEIRGNKFLEKQRVKSVIYSTGYISFYI